MESSNRGNTFVVDCCDLVFHADFLLSVFFNLQVCVRDDMDVLSSIDMLVIVDIHYYKVSTCLFLFLSICVCPLVCCVSEFCYIVSEIIAG